MPGSDGVVGPPDRVVRAVFIIAELLEQVRDDGSLLPDEKAEQTGALKAGLHAMVGQLAGRGIEMIVGPYDSERHRQAS